MEFIITMSSGKSLDAIPTRPMLVTATATPWTNLRRFQTEGGGVVAYKVLSVVISVCFTEA